MKGNWRTLATASVAVVTMAGILAACGTSSSAAPVGASKSTNSVAKPSSKVITFGLLPASDSEPYIVAQHFGYYKQAGLTVDLKIFKGGPLVMQAVAAGSIDGGKAGAPPAIVAIAGGAPMKIINGPGIAMMTGPEELNALVVSKSSGITSLKQLKGKTIAVQSLSGVGSILLQEYALPSVGLSSSDVHLETLPWASMAAAFSAGKIVAATPFSPYLQNILSTESNKVDVLANLTDYFPGKSFPLTVDVFSTKAQAQLGTATINAFLAATAKGVSYVDAHPNESKTIFASYIGIALSSIQNVPTGTFVSSINMKDLQLVADGLLDLKEISKKIDVASYVVTP